MSLLARPSKTLLIFASVAMLGAGAAILGQAAFGQDPAPATDNSGANKDGGKTAELPDRSERRWSPLRGPVRSEEEKSSIEAKAKAVAGVNEVKNELAIVNKGG